MRTETDTREYPTEAYLTNPPNTSDPRNSLREPFRLTENEARKLVSEWGPVESRRCED